MEDEEEEQYFDVSDEMEGDVSISLENVHSSTVLFLLRKRKKPTHVEKT